MIKTIIFDFYRTIYDPEFGCFNQGALEILENLRKSCRLFLISTGREERKRLIDGLNLKKFFVRILVVGEEKQKEDFLYCLKEGKCRCKETVVVGDSLGSEIIIGKSLGMFTIRLLKGKFSKEKAVQGNKPDYEIKSLLELPSLIARIERR